MIRSLSELEAAEKAKEEKAAAATQPSSGEESEAGSTAETPEKPAPTPDYAAGLIPSNPPPTPAAAPSTPLTPTPIPTLAPIKEPARVAAVIRPAAPSVVVPAASPAGPTQVVRLVTTTQAPAGATALVGAPGTVYRLVQPAAAAGQPVAGTAGAAQPAAPPKKSVALMLTVRSLFIFFNTPIHALCLLQREQMQEAQEMFKNANKVTRPEKALILGFMAGSRGTN